VRLVAISLRNLRIRMVSTILTIVSIAVATGLYAAITVMHAQTEQRYQGSSTLVRAVVGPKDASQLELVLNTIFNVGEAPGLFPLKVCDELRNGIVSRRAQVTFAIPQARGDSIGPQAFPVVATIDEMFSLFQRDDAPLRFAAGGPWQFTYAELKEFANALALHESARRAGEATVPPKPPLRPEWKKAVIGNRVARELGLGIGGTVVPLHGKYGVVGTHEHSEAACTVVGVLAPTNSPLDSTIYLPLGVYLSIGGHEGGVFVAEVPPGKNPEDAKTLPVRGDQVGLTAVLAHTKDHFGPQILRREFGTRPDAQVAWPQPVVSKFLQQIGDAAAALDMIAWLVLAVATVAIAVAIYNTMNERRREIAIMRSLGARRLQICTIIVAEASLLSSFGAVLGVLLCHVAARVLRSTVEDMTGVYLDWTAFGAWELYLVVGVGALGAAAGLLPAVKGSFTQVADNLAPSY